MKLILLLCSLVVWVTANCPNGDPVYQYGLTAKDKQDVVNAHNEYRAMIRKGTVPGQPRGINIKNLVYDENLAKSAHSVSNTCVMNHIVPKGQGQNLYMSMSSAPGAGANFRQAVKAWFDEHTKYKYPGGFSKATGHYTQVVWASTNKIGCSFTYFKNSKNSKFPYQKLYTCNYSPPGNFNNQPPYTKG